MSKKREVHIQSPIWNGTRTVCYVGIARWRVTNDSGDACKGNIRIWIDYKETDTLSPNGWKLMYPYPFDIKCSEIVKYPRQVLNDRNRTILHIIPISDLKEVRNYRSGSPRGRTMPQEEFAKIRAFAEAVKKEELEKEQLDAK
jgi:hypothetical protein